MPKPVRTVSFGIGDQAIPTRGAKPHWQLLQQRVARAGRAEGGVIARDFESRIHDRVGGRVVGVEARIEGREPAVFLRQPAVLVPAQAQRHGQIAAQFVVVVDERAHRVGSIVAAGVPVKASESSPVRTSPSTKLVKLLKSMLSLLVLLLRMFSCV